jgi:lipid-binding SYLF domain-containing protein
MLNRLLSISLLLTLLAAPPSVLASDQEAKMDEVVSVMQEIHQIPEQTVPPKLLRDAEGIAIIPAVVKVGVVIGGRYGKGVVSIRKADKSWSNPLFLSVKGGSVGWQIGAQSTDVILVFKTKRSLDGILKGKFTLGADAAVAAGPVGRTASAATDVQLKAEVYSYSRSRGLFAGIALDGAKLSIEEDDNREYYGAGYGSAQQVVQAGVGEAPASTAELLQLLDQYAE